MKIRFYKYQGTGNDFILIDNRSLNISHNEQELLEFWCNRHFGIGADGVILLEEAEGYDFRMVYFNSDGRQSSMCGNGGRCVVKFAFDLGLIADKAHFIAIDGEHEATCIGNWVELGMNEVNRLENVNGDYVLNTGSPHYVRFKTIPLTQCDLLSEAHSIRYNDRFKTDGINVNLVFDDGNLLNVRTYERGVENETLSCGTGVTAVALVNNVCLPSGIEYTQAIKTSGGDLAVRFFKESDESYKNIWLCGPATFVFDGEVTCLLK